MVAKIVMIDIRIIKIVIWIIKLVVLRIARMAMSHEDLKYW